jgi:hypothetical protein
VRERVCESARDSVRVRESEYERISVCVKRGGEREEERKKEGERGWRGMVEREVNIHKLNT